MEKKTDVVVIGAGAAGLMCAIEAGKRGRNVVVLEHNDRVGKKIAISGGGRCNFTNIYASAQNYLSANPDFCKSALARYTPWDFITLVEKYGVAYHEKKLGQQFCDTSSKQIIDLLLKECALARVKIELNCGVQQVEKNHAFKIVTTQGDWKAQSVVVACGGLSFPKIGATDLGYRIARHFGLAVTELRPGLVPLTWADGDLNNYREISGVAFPVEVSHRGIKFSENMLFTHRGLSGPAILQISSFWKEGESIEIDLCPMESPNTVLVSQQQETAELATVLAQKLPRRFIMQWLGKRFPAQPLHRFKLAQLENLERELHHWIIHPRGTEGYPKAEVTRGGVSTSELSSKTMETRRISGLYFIGEVVDVTGWLGGYNFQWAWASGHAAGQFV